MNSKLFFLSLVFFALISKSFSNENCKKGIDHGLPYACGTGCTGTPSCSSTKCGNVDNMCYCECVSYECKTSELGYTWNHGIKLENGSYALNGTKGDGGEYKCSR
jgi:hypothetical protein